MIIRRPTSQNNSRPIRSALSGGAIKRSASSLSVYYLIGITLSFLIGMLWLLYQMNQSMNILNTNQIQQHQQQLADEDATRERTTPENMRDQFHNRYGKAASHMLANGYHAYGSMDATAQRLLDAAANKRPFVMAFAGYSVTVGRGNHYKQSFPFVLGRLLEPLLRDTLQIPSVVIRNSAIGGIPSFPYGFCLEHFLGDDADVVSWDYSMNEGAGAAILEAYLRQSQAQLSKRPMMIVLDTNVQRCQLLEQYTKQKLMNDAICVGMAKDAVPLQFLELPEERRPHGLKHWDEFGAPPSCPGRGSWHPKKMEHEMIGWLMLMYFVTAVERAQQLLQQNTRGTLEIAASPLSFPPPLVSKLPQNEAAVTNLLYGHTTQNDKEQHVMKHVSCRTNFLPALDEEKVLSSIVVSGLAHDVSAENIMQERSDAAYRWGWVFDVSKVERDTKVKVEKCGGLGYVDMKIALYGIPESGTLRMWLPSKKTTSSDESDGDDAKNWFDTLIICEANEKRPKEACSLDVDLEYIVGGVPVTSTKMIVGAGEYLKRPTCVHVGVPEGAKVTRLRDIKAADASDLTTEQRAQLGKGTTSDDHVGLVVDVNAKASVTRKNGACCISHVVWEHH